VFIDIHCQQANHADEFVCGDVFLSRRIKEEGRTILVLADGMGSGIKANVLASITATMTMNFAIEHRDMRKTAEIIMDTLPRCSQRGMSYSTFTIIDIEDNGFTTIVEYDNPSCLVLKGDEIFDPGWDVFLIDSEKYKYEGIRTCSFPTSLEYRILLWSDGVIQSGMGTRKMPLGWGREALTEFVIRAIKKNPRIASGKLSREIISTASRNDNLKPNDDTTCAVVYFREPRRLLLVTGPPFDDRGDYDFALKVQKFKGKTIIAGGTTAEIIARELALNFETGMAKTDPDLPPMSDVEGFNLVTEGILTLGKVARLLENFNNYTPSGEGPADLIIRHLLHSDHIHLLVGTRLNMAHQDPNLPVEIEIRREVIKRISRLLEEKFLKDVSIEYS